jgi:hypothetical protein
MSDEMAVAISKSPCASCDNPRWESSYKEVSCGQMQAQRVTNEKRCDLCEEFSDLVSVQPT